MTTKLRTKLDTIFSKYIRLRDTNEDGYGQCITTGKWIHYSQADAGHFMSRRYMSTRWNEKNVNLQSRGSNRFNQGDQFKHALALDRKYGRGTAEVILSESYRTKKWSEFEISELIKYYKSECKRLLKDKNFDVRL